MSFTIFMNFGQSLTSLIHIGSLLRIQKTGIPLLTFHSPWANGIGMDTYSRYELCVHYVVTHLFSVLDHSFPRCNKKCSSCMLFDNTRFCV